MKLKIFIDDKEIGVFYSVISLTYTKECFAFDWSMSDGRIKTECYEHLTDRISFSINKDD